MKLAGIVKIDDAHVSKLGWSQLSNVGGLFVNFHRW